MTRTPAPGWLVPGLWRPRPDAATRVHRRIWLCTGTGVRRPRALAAQANRTVRWMGDRPTESVELIVRAAGSLGLPEAVVAKRVRRLAARGVLPAVALRLGLLRDDCVWPEYVSDQLVGWNLAAGPAGGRWHPLLADKDATNRHLGAIGIPVAPTALLPAGSTVEELRQRAADATLFVKPRRGHGGPRQGRPVGL